MQVVITIMPRLRCDLNVINYRGRVRPRVKENHIAKRINSRDRIFSAARIIGLESLIHCASTVI